MLTLLTEHIVAQSSVWIQQKSVLCDRLFNFIPVKPNWKYKIRRLKLIFKLWDFV